jgi:hypothetical protein
MRGVRRHLESHADIPSGRRSADPYLVLLLSSVLGLALGRILVALIPPVTPIETGTWIMLVADLCALLGWAAWQRSGELVRVVLLWGITFAGVGAGVVGVAAMGMNEPRLLSTSALVCFGYLATGILAGRALPTLR